CNFHSPLTIVRLLQAVNPCGKHRGLPARYLMPSVKQMPRFCWFLPVRLRSRFWSLKQIVKKLCKRSKTFDFQYARFAILPGKEYSMQLILIRHGEPDYSPCDQRGFTGFGRDLAP